MLPISEKVPMPYALIIDVFYKKNWNRKLR
jgi:hypothetical protein